MSMVVGGVSQKQAQILVPTPTTATTTTTAPTALTAYQTIFDALLSMTILMMIMIPFIMLPVMMIRLMTGLFGELAKTAT